MHPFVESLQRNPTLDTPARQAALEAVNRMLQSATRSGALLEAARRATAVPSAPSVARGRAAVLAQQAYEERANAEVAKYRAAFALMAEEHGNQQVVSARRARAEVKDSRMSRIHTEATKYHGGARDQLLKAAAATSAALATLPPLPDWVASKVQAVPTGPRETNAFPMLGWRPKKFNDMMYQFFPSDVRRAAGGLSGTPGGGLGVASDGVVGPTEPWYNSLLRSIGFGVKTVGQAAAEAGEKTAGENPATGGAAKVAGNLLQSLSTLLTGAQSQGQDKYAEHAPEGGIDVGKVVLWGGLATGAAWLLYRTVRST